MPADWLNDLGADILDGGQSEPNGIAAHPEIGLALIDVGRKHRDTKPPAFL